jgi:hypothetical protein
MTGNQEAHWHADLLLDFEPIQLAEMGHVALLRRTDTKYLLSEKQLVQALTHLTDDYRALTIEGQRLQHYRTLYFDTPDLEFYHQHHNGWRNRYKVRERAYVDSNISFWEVKHKIDAHTMLKSRIRAQSLSLQIAQEAEPFLRAHCPCRMEELEPKVSNAFQRITLVSRHGVERVTVDVGLRFGGNGAHASLPGIAIAEVKQDDFSLDSAFIQQMRALGVRATSFSKYSIAVSMLHPQVKHNRFKPQLCQIARLLHEGETACQT